MSDRASWRVFGLVLAVKLIVELVSRWSENQYLTGSPVTAAIGSGLVCAAAIPIARMSIRNNDNWAAAAIVLAATIATYVGALDLASRLPQGAAHDKPDSETRMSCCDQCTCQTVPRVTVFAGGEPLLDVRLAFRRGEADRGCTYSALTADGILRVEWSVGDDCVRLVPLDSHGHDSAEYLFRSIAEAYDSDRELWFRETVFLPVTVEAGETNNEVIVTLNDWLRIVPTPVTADELDPEICEVQPTVEDLGEWQYRLTRSTSCPSVFRVGHNRIDWDTNPFHGHAWLIDRIALQGAQFIAGQNCDPYRRDLYELADEIDESEGPVEVLGTSIADIRIELDLHAVSSRPTSRPCETCEDRLVQVTTVGNQWFPHLNVDAGERSPLTQISDCEWRSQITALEAAPWDFDSETDRQAQLDVRAYHSGGAWSVRMSAAHRYVWFVPDDPPVGDRRPEVLPLKYSHTEDAINLQTGRRLIDTLSISEGAAWWNALDHSGDSITLRVVGWRNRESVVEWARLDGGTPTRVTISEPGWTPDDRRLEVESSGWPGTECDGDCGLLNSIVALDTIDTFLGDRLAPFEVGRQLAGARVEVPDCRLALYSLPPPATPSPYYAPSWRLVRISGAASAVIDSETGPGVVGMERIDGGVGRVELHMFAPRHNSPKGVRHVFAPADGRAITEWEFAADSTIDWRYLHSIADVEYQDTEQQRWERFVWPDWPLSTAGGSPSAPLFCDPRNAVVTTRPGHATSLDCEHCEPYAGEPPMVWSIQWGPHSFAIPRTGGSRWSRELTLAVYPETEPRTLIVSLARDSVTWRLRVVEVSPLTLDDDDQPLPQRWPVLAEYVFVPEGMGTGHDADIWPATDDDPDPPRFARWRNDGTGNALVRTWCHPGEAALPFGVTVEAIVSDNPRGTATHDWSDADRLWIEDTDARTCADGHSPVEPYSRGYDTERLVAPCAIDSPLVDRGESVWWSPDGETWRLIARTCVTGFESIESPPIAPSGINDIYRVRCHDDSYAPTGGDFPWSDGEWQPFPENDCGSGRTCEPPDDPGTFDGERQPGTCVIVDCGTGTSEWVCLEPVGLAGLSWSLSSSSCPVWCSPTPPTRDPDFVTDFESGSCACTSPECP